MCYHSQGMEQLETSTEVKFMKPWQPTGLGYDILRSSVLFARLKCYPFITAGTFAIVPFMPAVYNIINIALLSVFTWYPDLLVNVLYMTFVPICSLISAVFDKYLKDLCCSLYDNVLHPIMPLVIGVVGYAAQLTVNFALAAVERLGYNGVLRILGFVFILILLQFFNVLIYIAIQLPSELLKLLFG